MFGHNVHDAGYGAGYSNLLSVKWKYQKMESLVQLYQYVHINSIITGKFLISSVCLSYFFMSKL